MNAILPDYLIAESLLDVIFGETVYIIVDLKTGLPITVKN